MDLLEITGGIPLNGDIKVSGAKNSVLPIMAAALLVDGPIKIGNAPFLVDVNTMSALLVSLGATVEHDKTDLRLNTTSVTNTTADYELLRRMRAGICVLGPLVARFGEAVVSLPGGCNIGHRPIDLHLRGLSALGADIRIEKGYVVAKAKQLQAAVIDLAGPFGSTVTGTCNILTAACLAKGVTTIRNAATEPEVNDLGNFLIKCGARIDGLNSETLIVEGVEGLSGCSHSVMPDRIEASTYAIAAAATRGTIAIPNAPIEHMKAVLDALQTVGVNVQREPGLRVACIEELRPVDILAEPYPGIPTDCQAQLMALLCTIPGTSVVTDNVFRERFRHVSELMRMGAEIHCQEGQATVYGGKSLCGASVMASDLRASAALVIAALSAAGTSRVHRIYHLDRGYERLEEKLQKLGAKVARCRGPRT